MARLGNLVEVELMVNNDISTYIYLYLTVDVEMEKHTRLAARK